jgi:hypothetical protein
MNLKRLFGGGGVLTAQERAQLDALDKACQPQREWLEKLNREIPENREARQSWLVNASRDFARNPSTETFARVQKAGFWGEQVNSDFETVRVALEDAVRERMAGQREIILGVLRRYLATLEKEHGAVVEREQKESREYGTEFKPSGIVRGLEQKILETRNRIARGDERHWREALAEFL